MIVWTANFGRGVDTAKFKANARDVLDLPGNKDDHSVWGIQELDEADAPDEHGVVSTLLEPGTTRAGWGTMEPILVGDRYRIVHDVITPACKGLPGWTPNRTIVQAVIEDPTRPKVPPVVVLNGHAPRRRSIRRDVRERVADFDRALKARVGHWYALGYSVIWTADLNAASYPRTHRGEQTAVHSGVDYIRFTVHPNGAQIAVAGTWTVPLTIDNHDAHAARLILTQPEETP